MVEIEEPLEISFSGDAVKSLKELQVETGARSLEEVVVNALKVYFTLWDYRDRKGVVIVESKGKKYELMLRALPEAKMR